MRDNFEPSNQLDTLSLIFQISSTEFGYSIAKTSKVELRLYDVTGRELAKLVDFNQNPGEYSYHLDGKSLASGTYFVRLSAGNFLQTQKMVLLK